MRKLKSLSGLLLTLSMFIPLMGHATDRNNGNSLKTYVCRIGAESIKINAESSTSALTAIQAVVGFRELSLSEGVNRPLYAALKYRSGSKDFTGYMANCIEVNE